MSEYEVNKDEVAAGERSEATSIGNRSHPVQEIYDTSQITDQTPSNKAKPSPPKKLSRHSSHLTSHTGESIDENVRTATTVDTSPSEKHRESDNDSADIQNKMDDYEPLSPKVEGEFFDIIKTTLLVMWTYRARKVDRCFQSPLWELLFQVDNGTIASLESYRELGTTSDAKAVLLQSSICRAWPQDRNSLYVSQIVVESDGTFPATEIAWGSVKPWYRGDCDESFHEKLIGSSIDRLYAKCRGYEDTWHRWCFAAAKHDMTSRPLFERRYRGKIVHCISNGHKKGFEYFALDAFAILLSHDEPFSQPDIGRYEFQRDSSLRFFSSKFKGNWTSYSSYHAFKGIVAVIWHIRYLEPVEFLDREVIDCVLSKRQTATIGQGSKAIYLQEKRVRISLKTPSGIPNLFHILTLGDCDVLGSLRFSYLENTVFANKLWCRYGLEVREKIIPITHFLLEICLSFDKSMNNWEYTLDIIENLAHVELNDFDDQNRVEDLMFDKSFNRSKDYFIALQLLRIVDEWVAEVVTTIEDIRDQSSFSRDFLEPALITTEADKNFDAVDRYIKERTNAIQKRIQKKTEEIKSLRDGLFNATSLRESTKAMALNQAIYVFTVVTVLFTPVSFLATFWALPFLNNPTGEGSDFIPEPPSFRSSLVAVPLLTYALVAGIAWYIGQESPNKILLALVKETRKKLRQSLISIWESRPWLSAGREAAASDTNV